MRPLCGCYEKGYGESMTRLVNTVCWIVAITYFLTPGYCAQVEVKAAITCRVVDDIEMKGVARARLSLLPSTGGGRITAFTGETGACTFPDVPPGEYVMNVEKAGYFPISGPKAIEFTSVPPKTDLGDIVLGVMRSIQGTVRWKNGDPADNVIAHALVVRAGRGVFRPGDVRLAMTNERGEFRLENLRPASYLLYSYTLGFRTDLPGRSALPVFYPDLPDPNPSGAIDLRKTKEAADLALTLQDMDGVSVSGTVTPSPQLPQGSPLYVGLMVPANPAQPFVGVQTEVGKAFQLQGIPPGNYILIMAGKNTPNRSAFALTVGASPIAGMSFHFVDSHEIECGLEYDLAQPRDAPISPATPGNESVPSVDLSSARVWAMSEQLQMFGVLAGRVGSDGGTHLQGAVPGYRYALNIEPPAGSYISRVMQAETELTGSPLQIGADDGRVRIVLRRDGGSLSGFLSDKDGKPTAGFVVLAPANRAKAHWLKTATPGGDGKFELTMIAPGKYNLFALPHNDNDSYLDEKYIERFPSTEITIAANAKQAIDVRLPAK